MFTQIPFSKHLIFHPPFDSPSISSLAFGGFPISRRKVVSFDTFLDKRSCFSLEFLVGKRRGCRDSWCCWGKGWGDCEGKDTLEAEILAFMNKSEKPESFPSKEELVKGGRMDLVEAILKKGGWLSMGWDSDDDNDDEKEGFSRDYTEIADFDIEEFQERVDSLKESSSFKEAEVETTHSSQLASPSGRSIDSAAEGLTGIEGILNRLEKDRNLTLGINLRSNGHKSNASSETDRNHTHLQSIADPSRVDLRENSRAASEKWRTWSSQRAGFTETEFEAAEICFRKDTEEGKNRNSQNDRFSIKIGAPEGVDRWNEIDSNQIQTRLKQLELELASTLHSIRSTSKEIIPKGHQSASSELQNLSDALEFQQNEVINAKDKLRSIRAKLAILEGKMALAIIDSQKLVEEKQRTVDGARRSLHLLRTACIVWPSTASEVLLTGSFDGWTTQRKMEKSKSGIFSLCLQLYPGRYEIKFIVDGAWKIDPLRPIVHNNGYENNLYIVT